LRVASKESYARERPVDTTSGCGVERPVSPLLAIDRASVYFLKEKRVGAINHVSDAGENYGQPANPFSENLEHGSSGHRTVSADV
jgi:hypothetical protein